MKEEEEQKSLRQSQMVEHKLENLALDDKHNDSHIIVGVNLGSIILTIILPKLDGVIV